MNDNNSPDNKRPPDKAKIILVTGVSGAGKSTTVDEVKNNKGLIPEGTEEDSYFFMGSPY